MASSIDSTKVLCITCNKAKGQFKCEGCSKVFCSKHSTYHRNELNKQLEEIFISHDLIQQTIHQQTEDIEQYPLVKKVNQWETESILKIHQTAEELRHELLENSVQRANKVNQKLQRVSNELKQGREEDDFNEIDLGKWTQKLEDLKNELINPTTVSIREDPTTLIRKISIIHQHTSDIFERVCGAAELKDNGYLAVKDGSSSQTEIRGKNEYSRGKHVLKFQIEHLVEYGWLCFGIISKSECMKIDSYNSSSAYCWSNRYLIYVAGQLSIIQTIEILENDRITLLIDCDQRKIELKSERLNRTQELPIDIIKCPFPWQLHLNLYVPNTAVRILSAPTG